MGVGNSKPKFIGNPKYIGSLNTDADKPGAAPAAPTEADLAMGEVNKWKQFMSDIIALPEAKDTIKTDALEEKAAKSDLAKKGIVADKDTVKKFVNGDRDFLPDVILYIKGTGLADSDKTPLKLDLAEAEKNSDAANGNKLKAGVTFDAVKPIFESIVKATRVAKKHNVFRKIIVEYVARLKTFQAFMKSENISGAKDAITSGEKGAVKNAKEEIKGKQEGGEDPPVPQGGAPLQPPIEGEGGGEEEDENEEEEDVGEEKEEGEVRSISSGTSNYTDVDPDEKTYGDELVSTGASEEEPEEEPEEGSEEGSDEEPNPETGGQGGVPLSGGLNVIGFRTDEDKLKNKRDKDYSKFKKEARGDFKKKMTAFFADNEAMAAFMDENEQTLLEMVYNGKIPGKWIDKSKETEKTAMVEALVTAINKYTPKEEEKKEGAPAAGEDNAAKSEPDPAEPPAADKPDAGKPDATPAAEPVKPAEPGKPVKPAAAKPVEPGKEPPKGGQGGGGQNTRKKKFTRRKPRHINIRINVGDKNVSTRDSSSSDSSSSSASDSSSSDNSSSSSSSSSEDESSSDEEEHPVKKRKYTRRNKTRA